jgi:hypothetical protein
MQEKNDVAETFLERVVAQDGEHVIAWTLYAVLYEQRGQELNAEITLKKVLKLNQAHYAELQASLLAASQTAAEAATATAEEERSKEAVDDVAAEEAKASEANKSRNSKRGGAPSQTQKGAKSDGSSKSKSPGASGATAAKPEDSGQNLKEKLAASELAIKKSIFMTTASFLIKYNSLVVKYIIIF